MTENDIIDAFAELEPSRREIVLAACGAVHRVMMKREDKQVVSGVSVGIQALVADIHAQAAAGSGRTSYATAKILGDQASGRSVLALTDIYVGAGNQPVSPSAAWHREPNERHYDPSDGEPPCAPDDDDAAF